MYTKEFNKGIYFCLFIFFVLSSCIGEKDLYRGDDEEEPDPNHQPYLYPYHQENSSNIQAEIVIETTGGLNLKNIMTEIPALKYNKSWLCMLIQDDCHHTAFSSTWAVINGKPLTNAVDGRDYYYDFPHLMVGDMPPGISLNGKTLGFTDGTGNEVRFAPTVTLAPEEEMDAAVILKKGYTGDYYRFYRKNVLIWVDLIEMLNYGYGISFHDVLANPENRADILEHFSIAQDITKKNISGRGMKVLAQPDNNRTYMSAGENFSDIQIMTEQSGGKRLFPFQLDDENLYNQSIERFFVEPSEVKQMIEKELSKDKHLREAVHIAVHNTISDEWKQLLVWINDNYGKDGDDSVWFPSMEEYYEYTQNRQNGTIKESVDGDKLVLSVNIPGGNHFYFPSLTINLPGLKLSDIQSVTSNDVVTGISYGQYEDGVMINIDCRKFLLERANRYVERYEAKKSDKRLKEDATYFVSMLKDSEAKNLLLERLN